MSTYKTMQICVKKRHRMYHYFQEMCQRAKNMHNTTNFYIRQIYTGLTQEKELLPLQKEVLDSIQKHVPKINDHQRLSYQKKRTKEKTKAVEKRKEITCHLFEEPSKEKPYVSYNFLDALFKSMGQSDYRSLPTQSSQGMMKTVFQNWTSFYASLQDYKANPGKYKAMPNIPGYCRSHEKEVSFSNQDCVVKNDTFLKFPKTKERLNIGKLGFSEGRLKQVRVVPKHGHYIVEMILEVPSAQEGKESKNRLLSIDLGNDNLATIVTNTGRKPVLVKGKNIKSVNQRYNQLKAHYVSVLRQGKNEKEGVFSSKRLEKIHQKRLNQIKDLFHKASFHIVKTALEEDIDTIVIGQNKDWKQKSNLGKRNNQAFVTIPHALLIKMIEYKAKEHGIRVMVTEESYTSKASFLDRDELPVHGESRDKKVFSGRRLSRGMYCSKNKTLINSDVNGSANIMRKVFPKAFEETIVPIQPLLNPIPLVLK